MHKTNYTKPRFDSILIWGHGMQYFDEILNDIRDNDNFKIIKIQKHKPKNIKHFVKEMYSFDYAPFWHLKAKTKYLMSTPNEVCFIFVENFNPDEDFLDEGDFRHPESMRLKTFKEKLRDKYNPYDNGKRSHNHVIHATDCQEQTSHMLNYLGYNEGVDLFRNNDSVIDCPYYLKGITEVCFKQLDIRKLYCNIIIGESWDVFDTSIIPVKESPQYLGLTQDMSIYDSYIRKYLGGPLQEDYNLSRYKKLSENFEYLSPPYSTSFVLVKEVDGNHVILDGVHRACNHIKQGHKEIKVCQLLS